MINKKIIMFVGMVLLVVGVTYASGVVLFGGNAYESNEDKLVLDMDLSEANYDSGTKTFTDDSGEGNDGVSVNAATFTTDKYGMSTGAMSFDGSSDYVEVASNFDNTFDGLHNFSISMWYYANSLGTNKLIEKMWFHIVYRSSSGKIEVEYKGLDSAWHDALFLPCETKQWQHLVVTYNINTGWKGYIDTLLEDENTTTEEIITSAYDLYIGVEYFGWDSYWNGLISQVKIYNRSLSATEVGALYDSSKPKASGSSLNKGLIGHWELDSESYNSATDRVADKTPYSNHGVNHGATLTTDQMGQSNRAMYFDGSSDYVNLGDAVLFKTSNSGILGIFR